VVSRHHVAGAFENQVAATHGGLVALTELLDDQRSRTVQAFDATGATAWKTTLEGPIPHDGSSAAMVAHDDRVVVTLNGEERIGLDAATGTPVWRSRAIRRGGPGYGGSRDTGRQPRPGPVPARLVGRRTPPG